MGSRVHASVVRVVLSCALFAPACGGGGSAAEEWTSSEELELLKGLDEPVILTEQQLDELFPLVEESEPVEDEESEEDLALLDVTNGGALEARLAAYVPTAEGTYFTIQPHPNVPAAFVEATRKGILFGMDNFDRLFPAFSLHAAAAAAPFDVVFFDTAKDGTGFRASVSACPNPSGDWAACRTRLNIPYDAGKAVRAATFVHELGHVAHGYYTRSSGYVKAGGVVMGPFRHKDFSWQREGSAQFITARSPDWSAYDRLGSGRCAFEALQRGATAWKDFGPTGGEHFLPYQMALLLDSVTWHHFADDRSWLLGWWVARPDGRDKTRPESAARALLRTLSPRFDAVDTSGANKMVVSAGYDLFARGRNPWTTRTLSKDCFSVTGTPFAGATPGAATLTVPAIAFDGVRIPISPGATNDLKGLRVSLVADRQENARAVVFAAKIDPWIACIQGLGVGALGSSAPRQKCNEQYAQAIGALTPENGYQRTLAVTDAIRSRLDGAEVLAVVFHHLTPGSPFTPITATVTVEVPGAQDLTITLKNASSVDHVHFYTTGDSIFSGTSVDAGSTGTMTVNVVPGEGVGISVAIPSDTGPQFATSTTCQPTDAPTNPTVTYTGVLTCTGF